MKKSERIFNNMNHKSQSQIVAGVKVILKAISDSKFAYDERKQTIDFDIALIGLTSTDINDIITIFSSFCNLKDSFINAIDVKDLAIMMEHCYGTISQLKKIPKDGMVYYDIITRYYIEKEFKNADDAMDSIDGIESRTTFFRRANEACLQLHRIWFCTAPKYYMQVLNEIISSL